MLKTSTGNIFELVKFDTALWLKFVMHLSHAGVYNAKALKAWDELQPYISSSKLTHTKKRVRALCIVLWHIRHSMPAMHQTHCTTILTRFIVTLNLSARTGSRRRHERLQA